MVRDSLVSYSRIVYRQEACDLGLCRPGLLSGQCVFEPDMYVIRLEGLQFKVPPVTSKLCDRASRAMVRCEVTESSPLHNRMHKNFPRQKHGIGVGSKALRTSHR